ncbi:MAG: hypothetical protein HC877_06570 [Thioploca sp.]|nr:hypothetical protein [Thioploca sp.]
MQTLNGNNRDKESFREMICDFTEQMRNDFQLEYLIANSALYSAENLKFMNAWKWISRVPETLRLASDTLDEWAPQLMCALSQSQCRRLETQYGEVKQRWVVIFSPEAYQRVQKTIDKQCQQQGV